jgi:hypothetical protein
MAHADAPKDLRPCLSGEFSEAAQRHGRVELEAEAYDRLRVLLV